MRGKCIDPSSSTNLKANEIYYLYPAGGSSYHVSRFPRPGSHFGTYQKSRFDIIEEEAWPPEPKKPDVLPVLESGKVYEAELVWKKEGYNAPLGKYFIRSTYGCYTNMQDCYFYDDSTLKQARGLYPIHWFTNIKEFGVEAVKELPQKDWKQMDLFNLSIISKLDR